MRTGILFWGFQDLTIVGKISERLRKYSNITEFYIQIAPQQKTISLIDISPEEILRLKNDDFNSLHNWLKRNESKSLIIVIDMWYFILQQSGFQNLLNGINKVLKENFHFVFLCPRVNFKQLGAISSLKINNFKTSQSIFSENSRMFFEFALNNRALITLFQSTPSISLLDNLTLQNFFSVKKFWFFSFVPSILKYFPAIFLSSNALIDKFILLIIEIKKEINLPISERTINFQYTATADYISNYYVNNHSLKNTISIPISLERLYKLDSKEEADALNWIINLGIMEYKSYYEPEHVMTQLKEESAVL